MPARNRTTQDGQILVIFTGALVVLLLIAALVIDLGFSFAIRRAEQNAADPGAIAAARFIRANGSPDLTNMRRAACFYARQDGLFPSATSDDGCLPANDPNGTTLTVNYPPSAAAGDFAARDGFVEVIISRQFKTFLAGLIGLNQLGIASSAVAAFSNGDSNSNSLVALDPGDCQTALIAGSGGGGGGAGLKVNVGGGVHVNSNCGGPVNPPYLGDCLTSGSSALKVSGTNAGLSTPAFVSVVGECAKNGSGATITTGAPANGINQGAVAIGDPLGQLLPPAIDITQPGQTCGGGQHLDATTKNQGCGTGGLAFQGPACPAPSATITCVTLNPGVYYGGWSITSGLKVRLLLNPGIYIFAGGGIKQTGSTIDAVTDASGNPGTCCSTARTTRRMRLHVRLRGPAAPRVRDH